MRKRVITTAQDAAGGEWLDLESLAEVELTSEDPAHPIESALLAEPGTGWRAADPGAQTIRLLFDPPRTLRMIRIEFRETTLERTQEYLIRWSADGREFRDVVRQQWNFSPSGATEQVEEHAVDLEGVAVLEVEIIPDVSGGSACASLQRLRLA